MKAATKKLILRAVWAGAIFAVFLVGVCCFPREYKDLSFLESVYYTIRLFILEHDLPHFPRTWSLRVIYFLAPLITFSAVWYAVKFLFHLAPRLQSRWMRDHIIVCGVGRTGKLIASTLQSKGVRVVGIDLGPESQFEEWLLENKIPVIFGDFHSKSLLELAGARRARGIIFAAGDDLANIDGAIAAYDAFKTDDGPVRLIWTHIANERLADTARGVLRTEGKLGIRFFDTYRIAASKMIAKYFGAEVRAGLREVTIVGFGKFGRDFMEMLIRDLTPNEMFSINVIDKMDRSTQVQALAEELGQSGRVSFKQADINDLTLVDDVDKAFIICTDDDLGNLTLAMALACKAECNHIYVRMTRWPLSAVAEHLGEDRGVTFVNINDLVVRGIGQLKGVFEPAEPVDLKRTK